MEKAYCKWGKIQWSPKFNEIAEFEHFPDKVWRFD